MRTVPFLKSLLCVDFFARVVIFAGITLFMGYQVRGMSDERVTLTQEPQSSPNRFSKTFGREKALDKLLAASDDNELLENLGSDEQSTSSNESTSTKSIIEEQPAHTKKL